ncbi:MAG: T9SS type A sorting domain-containing protein, partial [Flavobacteriales bacterium]
YGSYISYTKYLNFYHNSINCRGGSATAGRALTVFGSTSTLYGFNDIKNNIFANSGLGQAAYLNTGAISTFLTGMDYNIFTAASGNLVSQNGTLHTTLASWQTASSLDSNSIAAIPGFFSQTDLHLQGGVAADAGANVGVMVDIDGDTRPLLPSTGYDIGADEYIPPTCPMGYGLTGFNLTSSSVDVTWTVGSNDTTWIFEYGAPGFTPGSGTSLFSTNDTATISGLTPVTDYCVYVRGICAAGDTSLYFGPYCFKTRCVTSMSGTYTIDNSSPTAGTNFNSFADAMTELNNCGVSGPTVLLVDQGTYTEQVDIGAIVGASSTNTITFRADPTNTAPAILTFGATTIANNFVIEFTGAEHVIIDSLTITATGPTYGYAVSFRNAEHVTIKNCEINATNNTNFRCVPVYNHTTATHITENCTIENNKLNKGYYGMYWYGINTTQKEIGNKILNNEIKDFYLYGIMCYYQGGNTVEGNVIEQMPAATSTSYGMYVYYNDSCKIKSNKVTLTGAGTNYGLYINRGVGSATNKMEVINNMVSTSPSATRTAYGAYISYTKHLNFYHNSIHVRGGSATAGRALTCFGSTSTLYGNNNIRNNIFANSGPGNAMYINTGAASSAFLDDMDNNIYEASSGNYFNLNGTVHTTMAAYTTASNLDSNSLTGFPGFISGTDLHLQGAIAYDNGDSTVGVMVDIDGDPRPLAPSTGWDIGADEYIPPTCPSPYSMILDSVSTTAAWITWTNGPADSIWELQYGAPGFALGSGTTIGATTKPGMISGLTHSTCYEVWLRSICTVGDTSTWTGPFKFCTKCAPVTDYCTSFETTAYQVTPFCWDTYINTTATAAYIYNYIYRGHTGSNSIRFYNQNDAAGTFMLIAPAVSNLAAGTHRASFWAEGDSTIIIGTMSDPSDPATFTIFDTLAPQSGWTHYKVDFSSYAGTDSHVAILWDPSNTYDFMYLDDYCWEPIPSCEKAPSVTILNPGGDSTSMNIGWNLDTTQVSYIIAYGDSAYDPVTNPAGGDTVTSTTNFKQITGLKSLTEYCFWVKAICKNGDTSFWDGPHCAKTGCPDGIKPPYFDDFSAYQFVSGVGEVLPQCWSEAKGYLNTSSNIAGPTSFWTYDGFANVGFNGAAKVYVGGTNRNEWFVSPTFNLGSDPNVARIIEFDAALTRSGSATAPLRGLGHDDTVAFVVSYDKGITWKKADILIQWDSSGAPSHTGDHIVYEMKNTTGFVKFGFYAVSRITNEANEFFVDNFSIRDTTYASVGELTLEDQFKVYPNPNSGEFTILNKGNAKRSNVKLLDIQGRVVYDNQHNFTQNGQKQIQVTNLNSGVYVLLIQSDGKLEQHRVVIQ